MKLPNITFFASVNLIDKLIFTKHLAVMIKSGIPLVEAIANAKEQTKNTYFKKILSSVLADAENGQSLEKAFSKYPKVFDPLYISLVSIGEKSGNLENNLDYLSIQLRKSYEFGKKVQGALLYPEIILVATLLVGGSLSIFVMPSLVDLFKSLDVELPLSTKILLALASIMKDYGILIIGGLIALIICLYFLVNSTFVKPKWHRFLLLLPIIGPLNQNIILTSFCRDMGIMLKSGLTITSALEAESLALENLVYKQYVKDWLVAVDKGKKLADEIEQKKYQLIPLLVPKMIAMGENSGKLEDTLIYLGDFFEDEVEDTTKNLSDILEPILLIIIGIVVAFVALAIISPIYQLTSGIKK